MSHKGCAEIVSMCKQLYTKCTAVSTRQKRQLFVEVSQSGHVDLGKIQISRDELNVSADLFVIDDGDHATMLLTEEY